MNNETFFRRFATAMIVWMFFWMLMVLGLVCLALWAIFGFWKSL